MVNLVYLYKQNNQNFLSLLDNCALTQTRAGKRRQLDPLLASYGAGKVEKMTGISRITLHSWDSSGFFKPALAPGGKGTGIRRKYSFADLVALRVLKRLRDGGMSLRSLKKVAVKVREFERVENPFAQCLLAADGKDVLLVRGEEALSLLSAPGQYTMFLKLDLGEEAGSLIANLRSKAA